MANRVTRLARRSRDPKARPLTAGEIAMARVVFKDAIDYGQVLIYRRGYFPFGLQRKGTAVAPNGHIYFLPSDHLEDFSLGTPCQQRWLIHELTHVWQHQLGYPVRWRGALRVGLAYAYVLGKGKQLCDYNMEAQGDILADYFALVHLGQSDVGRHRAEGQGHCLEDYECALRDFMAHPGDRRNLP